MDLGCCRREIDRVAGLAYSEATLGRAGVLRRLLVSGLLLMVAHGPSAGAAQCGDIGLAFYELGALYYQAPDGSWTGIDKEIVDELGKRTGCRFHTVLESRVRIWTQMASGKLDMSVSGIANPEREKFARFIPYFATRNYALQRKSLAASASTPEGFLADPELRVAVVKSFKHGPEYDVWLDKLRAQGRVHDAPDFRAVVRLLKLGRVHAVLALPTSWVPVLEQENLTAQVRVLDWSPGDSIVHGLILSRERLPAPTMALLDKAIQAMRDDGTLFRIYKRHIGAERAGELLNF
jgi:polar amino acid transport system substrate-binding protein